MEVFTCNPRTQEDSLGLSSRPTGLGKTLSKTNGQARDITWLVEYLRVMHSSQITTPSAS